MNKPKATILLVEDDTNLAFVVKDNLELAGYKVIHAENGEEANEKFSSETIELCVFDVMLPKLDGFSLAQKIRQKNQSIPIIFLTARGLKEDRIHGFQLGGDDYITKPFSIEELLLRMEVFLKRSTQTGLSNHEHSILGSFKFNYQDLSLSFQNSKKKLTQKEADLLKLFIQHQGRVLRREEILKSIWGDDDYFLGRSLDVFVSRLRKYLSKDPSIRINTLHGTGFQLDVKELSS